jgi:hypothetical protein
VSEQERDRQKAASDEPDVEGHRQKAYGDEGSEGEGMERRETDEEPDVEAHRHKA